MNGARPRPGVAAFRSVHEWLGLICLAGLLAVGVTGAAIVFLGELFVLQYGDMVEVQREQRERPVVDIDHLLASAKEGHGAPFAAQVILMPHSRIPLDVALVYGVSEGAAADEPLMLGPCLVFYSLTGIATAKPAWFSSLMQSPFIHAPTFAPDDGRVRGPVLSLSEAVTMGQAEFPERRLASLNFGPEGRLVGMTFKTAGDLNHFYGDAHVWVDRQEGRVRESFLAGQKSPATAAGAAMHSLHAGFFFGVPGMAATVLSGLGLTALPGFGLVLWWRRRKKDPL